ncbi:MAG: hypothetical protein IH940_09115, partial [Acidobacteria bacterium]|nr:hypothetical protein [Acidobacteriota bacterium]
MTKSRGRGAKVSTAAGIIVGGAVAEALMFSMSDETFDASVLGSGGELTSCWGNTTARALSLAEEVLGGETLAIDVDAAGVSAAAIAYAANGWSAPLLVDQAATTMIGHVADLIDRGRLTAQSGPEDRCLDIVRTTSYAEVVRS